MVKDILTNELNELIIQEGDFVIESSEEQHIEAILRSEKGHWKESPMMGVGIVSEVNSTGRIENLEREIMLQLKVDDWQNVNLDLSDSENMLIEANKMENV